MTRRALTTGAGAAAWNAGARGCTHGGGEATAFLFLALVAVATATWAALAALTAVAVADLLPASLLAEPLVLDGIVRPFAHIEQFGDLGPLSLRPRLHFDDGVVLHGHPLPPLDAWMQVVVPSFSTLLPQLSLMKLHFFWLRIQTSSTTLVSSSGIHGPLTSPGRNTYCPVVPLKV